MISGVDFENKPGTLYIATLTGPEHQAHHSDDHSACLVVPEFDRPLSVTVQLRCALFNAARARSSKTTPCPTAFFTAVAKSFTKSLGNCTIRGPTLQECQQVHNEAVNINSTHGNTNKKRRKAAA